MSQEDLTYRSEFLLEVFKDFVAPEWAILEIGYGDKRNLNYLVSHGYPHVDGIDKKDGCSIEEFEPRDEYDVVFSMSTLFLIPPENNWVFEKIAKMAKKYIITIEGENVGYRGDLFERNYADVFKPYGFEEVLSQKGVFNRYGVLRVLKRNG
jgi:hypothetical protein